MEVLAQKTLQSLPLQDYAGKVSQGKPSPVKTSPGFIGNYIHDFSILGWHHHKKQRPSKHARRRAREKAGKWSGDGGGFGGRSYERQQRLPESGYDTVGEQPASSPPSSTAKSQPIPQHMTSVTTSSVPVDAAFKRLLKDLHRCDVFIARSQRALQQVSISHTQTLM